MVPIGFWQRVGAPAEASPQSDILKELRVQRSDGPELSSERLNPPRI